MMQFVAIAISVGLAFGNGDVWRAISLEIMCGFCLISALLYIDTPFMACVVKQYIEDQATSFGTVQGKVYLNLFIAFFCLQSFDILDLPLLITTAFVVIWTGFSLSFFLCVCVCVCVCLLAFIFILILKNEKPKINAHTHTIVIMTLLYSRLKSTSEYIRSTTGSIAKLEEKFKQFDSDRY